MTEKGKDRPQQPIKQPPVEGIAMINPITVFVNFFVILGSLWLLFVSWAALVFLLGLLIVVNQGCGSFGDSIYLAYSTALSLGTPNVNVFSGFWCLLELSLDFMGITLWGILTAVTFNAVTGAYE